MEDNMIIELYWARSQQAIEESQRKYGAYCRSIARGILELDEDAEECVNDTWFRAWTALPPQRPNLLSAFFAKLTRNLSLDVWRKNRAAKRGGNQVEVALHELEDCLPDHRSPELDLVAGETAAVISAFLHQQPQLDRRLFVRRYFQLESIAMLGEQFDLSEGQVKSRLHRTRQKLRAILAKEGIAV